MVCHNQTDHGSPRLPLARNASDYSLPPHPGYGFCAMLYLLHKVGAYRLARGGSLARWASEKYLFFSGRGWQVSSCQKAARQSTRPDRCKQPLTDLCFLLFFPRTRLTKHLQWYLCPQALMMAIFFCLLSFLDGQVSYFLNLERLEATARPRYGEPGREITVVDIVVLLAALGIGRLLSISPKAICTC